MSYSTKQNFVPLKLIKPKVVSCLHVTGQFGQTLPATSPNAKEESIAKGLPDDAQDSAHVLDGITEENQIELLDVHLVVVLHCLKEGFQ